jgi:AhpD family alkylhydroperoxidase
MSRDKVYEEMKQMLGMVPTFFEQIPEDVLDHEWSLFKRMSMEEGPIPFKYRELIGLGIAGTTHCQYCTLFHTEMARLHGASDEEIEFANRVAKNSAGWSTYLNGMQTDYGRFREELNKMGQYIKSQR